MWKDTAQCVVCVWVKVLIHVVDYVNYERLYGLSFKRYFRRKIDYWALPTAYKNVV